MGCHRKRTRYESVVQKMEKSKRRDLLKYAMKSHGSEQTYDSGWATYHNGCFSPKEANLFFDRLHNTIAWENDVVTIFGKRIVTKRKVAWYGDKPFEYSYSKTLRKALPWTEDLKELLRLVSEETGVPYNSCLLNLYHNGEEGMGWHSDDEKELVRDGTIASLSLGAERPFFFKHKVTKDKVEVVLENGSLLVMGGAVQRHWLHSLPKRKNIHKPRINLTFRMIDNL